jgi:hypothetical protein
LIGARAAAAAATRDTLFRTILEKNARVRIDRERVLDVVRREIYVGKAVWESHRLLEGTSIGEGGFVDEFVKDRAGQGLAHVRNFVGGRRPSVAFRPSRDYRMARPSFSTVRSI